MGMMKLFSSHSCDKPPGTPIPQGNPNPIRFTILRAVQVKRSVVVKIQYPDCTNYEGVKILVFKETLLEKVTSARSIDPHFTDKATLKPFARFEPTAEGWNTAVLIAAFISNYPD